MSDQHSDEAAQTKAESAIEDMLFGPEETETPAQTPKPEEGPASGDEREVEPVVEGEESEEPEKTEDDPEEALVEVEFEGQLLEAPKAVAEALMRAGDYTQKTQEVAAQRKEVELAQQQVEQTQKQYEFAQSVQDDVIKAQQLEALAGQWRDYLRTNVETLSSTDIEKARLEIDEALRQRDTLVTEVQGKQQKFEQAQEQSRKELLDKSTQVLRSKIPGWDKAQDQVREYVTRVGFTDSQLTVAMTDPRQMELAYKAMRFDQLQAGKTPAVTKAKEVVKTKPRNPMPKATQDKLNLRKQLKSKNLSNQDKANLIGNKYAERFGM